MGIRLKGQTSGYVEIKAPATAADNTLTFPNGNGSSNQVLTTDGSGGLTFAAPQVSTDTTPQLGGNLDVNGNDIVTTSNGDVDLDPNGSGQVVFKGNATRGSGAVKLNCENNSHGILVKGPPHSAGANYTLTLPNDTGTSGQLLSTNGSGVTSWSTVNASPSFEATADGALTDGMPVIIQADGTVRTASSDLTQHTITASTLAEIYNYRIGINAMTYNETYDQFVQVAEVQESGLNNYGIAWVHEINGDSFTVNTGQTVNSGINNTIETSYDPASGTTVFVYVDESNNTYARAATHTGSGANASLNFGYEEQLKSGSQIMCRVFSTTTHSYGVSVESGEILIRPFTISGTAVATGSIHTIVRSVKGSSDGARKIAVATNGSNEALIVFSDNNDSGHGYAIPLSLNGNTITTGTAAEFSATDTLINRQGVVYDKNANKYLIGFRDSADGDDCHLVVATVTNSSTVAFGTVNEFEGDANNSLSLAYDPIGLKTLVVVSNDIDGKYTGQKATITGTSVAVDTAVNIETETTADSVPAFAHSPDAERFMFAFEPSSDLRGKVIKTATQVMKLTAENYIGISDGAYANGATATIQIVGSVDDAQSGLTPGQSYFVQNTGGISPTADSPSVFAGTAVAATKLIVKG